MPGQARESWEILVCKCQKLLLDLHESKDLGQHCIRNRHSTTIHTATGAWVYPGKPFSLKMVEAVGHCIQKCNLKLHYTSRKPYISSTQKPCRVLWAGGQLRWTGRRRTRGQKSPQFIWSYMPNMWSENWKSHYQGWFGDALVLIASVTSTYVMVPLMQRCILEFWNTCCFQGDVFSAGQFQM